MREAQTSTVQTWIAFGALYITAFAGVVTVDEYRAHLAFGLGGLVVAYVIAYGVLWTPALLRRTRVPIWAVAIFVILAALYSLIQSYRLWNQENNEQQIRMVILQGTQQELDWYKAPTHDLSGPMKRYFLSAAPTRPGGPQGDRLARITEFIESLRADKQRFGDTASRALFFTNVYILPDGVTANVETSEIWYQPLLVQEGNSEVEVDLPVEKLNLYTDKQFYILRKIGTQWYIESNPAPVAAGAQ